jgi:hypothetical protein
MRNYCLPELAGTFPCSPRDYCTGRSTTFLAAVWQTFNEYEIADDVTIGNRHPGTASDSLCSCASPDDVAAR